MMNRKQRRTAAKVGQKQPKATKVSSAADALVQKAIEAIQQGAFAQGESALDEVLIHVPGHVEALHQKGMLMARTDRLDDGIALLRRVVEARPDQALYWNNLAAACLLHDALEEARDASRRAVKIDPGYVMALRNLAVAAGDLGDHREAADALREASRRAPNDAEVSSLLGLALLELNDAPGAETALAKAVALNPQHGEYRGNLGVLLVKQGKSDAAMPHLAKAVELNPDQFAAALHYGIALALANDYEKGLRWLRRATSIDNRSDAAWGALADAALAAGQRTEALDAARRASEIAPSDAVHRKRLQQIGASGAAADVSTSLIKIHIE